MAKPASESMEIAASRDKRAISATFIIDLAGNFLSMQLIYWGKIDRSLPKVDFPKGFSLSAYPKHYGNAKETQNVTNEIIFTTRQICKGRIKTIV